MPEVPHLLVEWSVQISNGEALHHLLTVLLQVTKKVEVRGEEWVECEGNVRNGEAVGWKPADAETCSVPEALRDGKWEVGAVHTMGRKEGLLLWIWRYIVRQR